MIAGVIISVLILAFGFWGLFALMKQMNMTDYKLIAKAIGFVMLAVLVLFVFVQLF